MKASLFLIACFLVHQSHAAVKASAVKSEEAPAVTEEVLQELDFVSEDLEYDEEDEKFMNLTNDADPIPEEDLDRVALKKELEKPAAKQKKSVKK